MQSLLTLDIEINMTISNIVQDLMNCNQKFRTLQTEW